MNRKMADIDFDKKASDLHIGDIVTPYGVMGGPFVVVGINFVNGSGTMRSVTMRDSKGCVINARGSAWDPGYALSDEQVGEFLGYEQDKVEAGRRLLSA